MIIWNWNSLRHCESNECHWIVQSEKFDFFKNHLSKFAQRDKALSFHSNTDCGTGRENALMSNACLKPSSSGLRTQPQSRCHMSPSACSFLYLLLSPKSWSPSLQQTYLPNTSPTPALCMAHLTRAVDSSSFRMRLKAKTVSGTE